MSILSPGYPNAYPNSAHAQWIFSTDEGVFLIQFIDFNTEFYYDNVYIGKGMVPLVGTEHTLSGNSLPSIIYIESTAIWIVFTSDSSYTETGFHIDVSVKGKIQNLILQQCYWYQVKTDIKVKKHVYVFPFFICVWDEF